MARETTSSRVVDDRWEVLPNDLLELILRQLLTLQDRILFGTVCNSWHSVLTDARKRLPPPEPLLLLPRDHDDDCELWSLSHPNAYRSLHLPTMLPQRKFCIGSSHGWLFMVNKIPEYVTEDSEPKLEIYLLNPITGVEIQLPSPTPGISIDDFHSKAILSSEPRGDKTCFAIAILGCARCLAFCRVGEHQDSRWTRIATDRRRYKDIIYFREKIFAVTESGHFVVVDDVEHGPKTKDFGPPPNQNHFNRYKRYLVESEGELLQVIRDMEITSHAVYYFEERIKVFMLDFNNRSWSKVRTLGERALLIGDGCSTSISVRETSSYRKNRIYFVDNLWDPHRNFKKVESGKRQAIIKLGRCLYISVFSLEDGRIRPLRFFSKIPRDVWTFWLAPES